MDPSNGFVTLQEALTTNLVSTTRLIATISNEDLAFHRSINSAVANSLDDKNIGLLRLTERLLERSAHPTVGREKQPALPSVDAIDARWRRIVDVANGLFENADKCLDQYTGLTKPRDTNGSISMQPPKVPLDNVCRNASVSKPQLLFDYQNPNRESGPFRPLLSTKPHSTTTFQESFKLVTTEDGVSGYQHPYEDEIHDYRYPDRVYEETTPQRYQPFENTQATYVDTLEGVDDMLEHLRTASEIAIDLEHHEKHSYIGLVSLMQISTRDHDWIVDTLKPWRRQLERLNEVFADPKIVKVLHGSHSDIIWLQRDFGLYVVGLFDTYDAARALSLPGAGLAFLLKKYVNFNAQKQYQMADWRVRPIPAEMLDYARSDTHFLLYIYDCMREELVGQSRDEDLITRVLANSKETALQRYERQIHSDDLSSRHNGWAALLCRSPTELDQGQVAVLSQLYKWRDAVARQEDENPAWSIMTNVNLLAVAKKLPAGRQSLLAVSHPISPILRSRANEVLEIVARAPKEAGEGPDATAVFTHFPSQRRKSQRLTARRENGSDSAYERKPKTEQELGMARLRQRMSKLWGNTLPTNSYPDALRAPAGRRDRVTVQLLYPSDAAHQETNGTRSTQPTGMNGFAETISGRDTISSLPLKRSHGDARDSTNSSPPPPGTDLDPADVADIKSVQNRAKRHANKIARNDRNHQRSSESYSNLSQTPGDAAHPHHTVSSAGYDYEAAPSVLHAKRPRNENGVSKAAANPYAKGEGASHGLKRAQNPSVGRSHTFKG